MRTEETVERVVVVVACVLALVFVVCVLVLALAIAFPTLASRVSIVIAIAFVIAVQKKVRESVNKLFRKLAEKLIVSKLRAAAEGDFGPAIASVMLFLRGRKTYIGFALGFVGFTMSSGVLGDFGPAATWLAWLGSILFAAGLTDKALRQPGRPEWAANSVIYNILGQNAAYISSALLAAGAWSSSSECLEVTSAGSCSAIGVGLKIVSAFIAYIGIVDVAFVSRQPFVGHPKR